MIKTMYIPLTAIVDRTFLEHNDKLKDFRNKLVQARESAEAEVNKLLQLNWKIIYTGQTNTEQYTSVVFMLYKSEGDIEFDRVMGYDRPCQSKP